MSSGASQIAGDRPVPHIVTELPGPKARAHVAFDETWTSPSLPRAYPIVPVRGEGLTIDVSESTAPAKTSNPGGETAKWLIDDDLLISAALGLL